MQCAARTARYLLAPREPRFQRVRYLHIPSDGTADRWIHSGAVKAFKRLLVVLGVAALIGALARLRGKGGVPPTSGGWRELEGPDFR